MLQPGLFAHALLARLCRPFLCGLALTGALATLPSGLRAASFGAAELESGLGERLRVVLPITGPLREPLSVDCIKLYASNTEPYDVSNQIRAGLIQRGNGQAVVLTTSQPMNEVVVSFEAAIGCGVWFSRRYTFFLDLPRDRPATAPVAAPAAVAAAAEPAPAPAAKKPKPRRVRERLPASEITAPVAVQAPPSVVRKLRPEDEPGILARNAPRKPLAGKAPVRQSSMLSIDLGGLDQFLSAPRSPIEELTGMRMAGGLNSGLNGGLNSGVSPGGAASGGARATANPAEEREFKLAHARFLAAIKDKPDPVGVENAALAARLDTLAKDIASLKLDLQTSSARAKELEATRVQWWWLLIAGLAAAAVAAGLVMRLRKAPPRQLILIDPDERAPRGRAATAPARAPLAASDENAISETITETMRMPEAATQDELMQRSAQNAARAEAMQSAAALVAAAAAPAAGLAVDHASTPSANLTPAAPLKLDKSSLTQQLATMTDLSDEAWASYRHPSDTNGVAIPFGGGGGAGGTGVPVKTQHVPQSDLSEPIPYSGDTTSIELNFDLGQDIAAHAIQATAHPVQLADPAPLEFDPAAAAAASVTQRAGAEAGEAAGDFTLDTMDVPSVVLRPRDAPVATGFEDTAPTGEQALLMQTVMASASTIMEAAHSQWTAASAAIAMKTLATYLEAAPANAPPGPWIMLAHVLHEVGMKRQYVDLHKLFSERFGAQLPSWDDAYAIRKEQLGLARVPGVEKMFATGRGTPELIGRLAGLAYRVEVPQPVLFDLQFHREVLQLAAECEPDSGESDGAVDIAL